ncbi:unnamed protein product [Caenorhabditis bovis]|uniref:Uncharacterized protein n=1 Tax=Caenorhabditis bovis TaxID=2654633 RepID=A0A8S1EMK1_9PELO|nr:unnamed protein product [Caenorhabditis bovis]
MLQTPSQDYFESQLRNRFQRGALVCSTPIYQPPEPIDIRINRRQEPISDTETSDELEDGMIDTNLRTPRNRGMLARSSAKKHQKITLTIPETPVCARPTQASLSRPGSRNEKDWKTTTLRRVSSLTEAERAAFFARLAEPKYRREKALKK